ncbi:hypothetical protein WMY93_013073 [Mugilogobius chulae]|uniref:Uncharacterized protein n=1 Tax=Mugilogobius chulae TaxID=88201 RepID=A0AAW0P8Z3_9GOBI
MLSWVVKVVPQPPDLPKNSEGKEEAAAAPPAAPPEKKVTFKDEAPNAGKDATAAEESRPGTAVLSWISNAMPQPVNANNSANKQEESPPTSKGMIAWISQGLEKVVPHPELKNKESPPAEKPVEVRPATAPAAPVSVEAKTTPRKKLKTTQVGHWKVVPQPEHLKAKAESSAKNEAPPAPKVEAPQPPPAPKPAADETVVGWIVNGLGRMLPQPVLKSDLLRFLNVSKKGTVHRHLQQSFVSQSGIASEQSQMSPGHRTVAQLLPTTPAAVLKYYFRSKIIVTEMHHILKYNMLVLKLDIFRSESEDAEAQTEPLNPLKESIKKETEEAVLAQMEERLQVERLAAARAAEELALRAAQEAVRQLELEQEAKIIIDSLHEPPEHLPNIQEEENEDDPDRSTDDKTAETTDQKEPEQQPITEKQEQESKPITQQPEPQAAEAPPTNTDQEQAATTEETGCGTPAICSPIRTFMLRFPLAAEYLESCKKLMHDNYLTPPKLSLPSPPPELALLTQELAELPKQAQQYCLGLINKIKSLNTYFQTEPSQNGDENQAKTESQPAEQTTQTAQK